VSAENRFQRKQAKTLYLLKCYFRGHREFLTAYGIFSRAGPSCSRAAPIIGRI
jgi:hypothetical protein